MAHEKKASDPVKIVLLYHDKDKAFKTRLREHLRVFELNRKIILWDKDDGIAGGRHEDVLNLQLAEARIILFFVSSRVASSDILVEELLPDAIKRALKNEVILIPILARDFNWEDLGLQPFTPLPKNKIAIEKWEDTDSPYKEISREIEKTVNKIIQEESWEKIVQQDGELNPEFKDLEDSFSHSPDLEVMQHPNFQDFQEHPRSTAHFLIYKEMLSDLREKMKKRRYRFCVGNLEDANNALSIIERVGERLVQTKSNFAPSFIKSVDQFKKDLKGFKSNISDSDWENPSRTDVAVGKYILPFCDEIEKFEQKIARFAANSILGELPPLGLN